MRLLVTSDWHLDYVTMGVSRFDEIAAAARESLRRARMGVDAYIFLGDLCDPDKNLSPFRALHVAQEIAIECWRSGIPSFWLRGNHCVIEDGSNSSVLTPMRALEWTPDPAIRGPRLCVFDEPRAFDVPELNARILALPYPTIAKPYDPEEWATAELQTTERLIVLGHLSLEGVIPGEESAELARGRDIRFPIGILKKRKAPTLMLHGHYHERQTTPDGVIIPGSLARLTFGAESHVPGFSIVEW